jgi:membrane protease YdiL (CAAX protease family)
MAARTGRSAAHLVIAIDVACGLAIGLSFLPLIPVVRALGWPRDASAGLGLFGFLPLLIVLTGVACPRLPVNLLGLLVAVVSWAAGFTAANLALGYGFRSVAFNLAIVAPYLGPGYVLLALAVWALRTRGWSIVVGEGTRVPDHVRRPVAESVFALGYAALYIGYLCLHREGELTHWLTLVGLPFLGVWLIRSGRRSWASLGAALGSVGLARSRLTRGIGTAVVVGVLLQLVQLAGRQQREALRELVVSGAIWYVLPLALVLLLVTAAFTEEFFFRGVLQTRLAALCGSWLWAVLITSVVFALYHVPYTYFEPGWGSAGRPVDALVTALANGLPGGLILGWVFARAGGNLLAPIITHALIDVVPAMRLIESLAQ